MTTWSVREAVCSDKPTANYHVTLEFKLKGPFVFVSSWCYFDGMQLFIFYYSFYFSLFINPKQKQSDISTVCYLHSRETKLVTSW